MKNASTRYIFFKLNYKYHLRISYKKDINSYLVSKVANKSAKRN